MSSLYIVATPIGNMRDITLRALDVLKRADLILCEDTRQTKKLLNYYQIHQRTLSYHQHSNNKKTDYILNLLKEGKQLALVCDAGTPGISDPGNKLIREIFKNLGEDIKVIPIPGASSLSAAASISGFAMDRFLFLGFPPQKRKRRKFILESLNSKYPVIFFESPYRIIKTLQELNKEREQLKNEVEIVVCRELTKKFETIYRGSLKNVLQSFLTEEQSKPQKIKQSRIRGEFTVVLKNNP